MKRRMFVQGQPALRDALAARGWVRADADRAALLWLAHAPSRGWLRARPAHQRVNALPGIGTLLEPERRRDLVAAVARRAGRLERPVHDALPWTWRLPEEGPALAEAAADGDVLLLRRRDSAFDDRWQVAQSASLPPGLVAMARPLDRRPEDLCIETLVVLTEVVPLRALLHRAPRARALDERSPAAPCPEALRERVLAETAEAVRVLLAAVREDLLEARAGDFGVLAFEWHVRADGSAQLLDVHRGPCLDPVAQDVARLLDTGDVDTSAFMPLWPAAEHPAALACLPAPRLEDADAAGVPVPARLAESAWRPASATEATLDGLPVLHDSQGERLVPLDPVGAYVWLRCADGQTPIAIAAEIAQTYGVDAARVQRDVWRLLAAWAAIGLIMHADDAPPPPSTPQPRPAPRSAGQCFGIGMHTVALHGAAPEVLTPLADLLAGWAACNASAAAAVEVARSSDGRWRLAGAYAGEALPDPAWLAYDLHDALTLQAAWPDGEACAVRGALLGDGDGAILLMGSPLEAVDHTAALLHAADTPLAAAPYVPLADAGAAATPFPGGLAVPETGRPGALARLAAWRAARPLPRRSGGPVRLVPTAAAAAGAVAIRPRAVVFLEIAAGAPADLAPLPAVEALDRLVRAGLPAGRPLGAAQARALVACIDGRERYVCRAATPADACAALDELLAGGGVAS